MSVVSTVILLGLVVLGQADRPVHDNLLASKHVVSAKSHGDIASLVGASTELQLGRVPIHHNHSNKNDSSVLDTSPSHLVTQKFWRHSLRSAVKGVGNILGLRTPSEKYTLTKQAKKNKMKLQGCGCPEGETAKAWNAILGTVVQGLITGGIVLLDAALGDGDGNLLEAFTDPLVEDIDLFDPFVDFAWDQLEDIGAGAVGQYVTGTRDEKVDGRIHDAEAAIQEKLQEVIEASTSVPSKPTVLAVTISGFEGKPSIAATLDLGGDSKGKLQSADSFILDLF